MKVTNTVPLLKSNTKPVVDFKQRISEESKFIAQILSYIQFPKQTTEESGSEVDDLMDASFQAKAKNTSVCRVGSVTELQEKFRLKMEELRGNNGEGRRRKVVKKLSKQKIKKSKKKGKDGHLKEISKKISSDSSSVTLPAQNIVAKPVYKEDGSLIFSKFDFTNTNKSKNAASINPKTALQKLQVTKDKLQILQQSGRNDQVKTIKEKAIWNSALEKSRGIKVKDDENLLKKSIKKLERRKKASIQKWNKHKEVEEGKKVAQQKKRGENLSARKREKKLLKLKKSAKKGRLVPGFR